LNASAAAASAGNTRESAPPVPAASPAFQPMSEMPGVRADRGPIAPPDATPTVRPDPFSLSFAPAPASTPERRESPGGGLPRDIASAFDDGAPYEPAAQQGTTPGDEDAADDFAVDFAMREDVPLDAGIAVDDDVPLHRIALDD